MESQEKPEEISNEEKESHIRANFEIEQLRKPLLKIIEELGPAFEKGEYDVIIGDDASGRIPALSVWEAAKAISQSQNQPAPELKFIAGSGRRRNYDSDIEKLNLMGDFIEDWGKIKKKLVITEYIDTGQSLEPLVQLLDAKGYGFDIATVSLSDYDVSSRLSREALLSKRIISGGETGLPAVYGKPNLAGVSKNRKDLFSQAISTEEIRRDINSAHSQALSMGQQIGEFYVGNRRQKQLDDLTKFQNHL